LVQDVSDLRQDDDFHGGKNIHRHRHAVRADRSPHWCPARRQLILEVGFVDRLDIRASAVLPRPGPRACLDRMGGCGWPATPVGALLHWPFQSGYLSSSAWAPPTAIRKHRRPNNRIHRASTEHCVLLEWPKEPRRAPMLQSCGVRKRPPTKTIQSFAALLCLPTAPSLPESQGTSARPLAGFQQGYIIGFGESTAAGRKIDTGHRIPQCARARDPWAPYDYFRLVPPSMSPVMSPMIAPAGPMRTPPSCWLQATGQPRCSKKSSIAQ